MAGRLVESVHQSLQAWAVSTPSVAGSTTWEDDLGRGTAPEPCRKAAGV